MADRRKIMIAGLFTMALAYGASAAAQEPAIENAPAAIGATASEKVNLATPAMWRVADEDSEFILLGTFHILPPGLSWRTDALNAAFAAADSVYFEVDATASDAQSKTLGVVMMQGFNPPGVTLTGMLEEADANKLRDVTTGLGLPIAAIDPMRPWQAFLTISVKFIIDQGFDPSAGVDSVLLSEARVLGKDLVFFETIEEQLALFTDLPPETEKKLLVLTLRDWDNQAAAFDDLFDAWRDGDAEFIDTQMNEMMRDLAPDVYDRLIVARNKAWADVLEDALNDGAGKSFIAVGAAHLAGVESSVPALLAERGFTVSRYGVTK